MDLRVDHFTACAAALGPSELVRVGKQLVQAVLTTPWSTNVLEFPDLAEPDVDISYDDLDELHEFRFGAILDEQDGSIGATSHMHTMGVALIDEVTPVSEEPLRRTCPAIINERPAKRQRMNTSSIYHYIPQPHYCGLSMETGRDNKMDPYDRRRPIPIGTYTSATMSKYLFKPYARGIWIVPIRSEPPWKHATPSFVQPEDVSLPTEPIDGAPMSWTQGSLKAFWDYLCLSRRRFPSWDVVVAFHPAPAGSKSDIVAETRAQPRWSDHSSHSVEISPLSLRLEGDHLKVYHNIEATMRLRRAMDVFPFPQDAKKGEPKIRITKGACLVLLDERSRPLLVC